MIINTQSNQITHYVHRSQSKTGTARLTKSLLSHKLNFRSALTTSVKYVITNFVLAPKRVSSKTSVLYINQNHEKRSLRVMFCNPTRKKIAKIFGTTFVGVRVYSKTNKTTR